MKYILFLLLLSGCKHSSFDDAYICSALWSWDEGFKIGEGDFVMFDKDSYVLKNDTIFREGRPSAIVTGLNKRLYIMEITSLDGKQQGRYRNTAESTE